MDSKVFLFLDSALFNKTEEEFIATRDFRLKRWCNQNWEYHRDNGPAVVYSDGHQEWYQNGALHRTDGPAIVCTDGSVHWYFHHMNLTDIFPINVIFNEKK